nr:copia protein [Tanacetum cinerariifolium]
MTFGETPLPSKTSPLVDDDLDKEEAIKIIENKNLENDIVDETLEIDEIINIKESRNHPLENFIGNLNQRALRLQIKQMEDGIFFSQSKYIKEMIKKFGLKDSKSMKTPMSSDTKLTKDEECESVDSTMYRGMIDSLLYLTFSKKQIALAISTIEAEYLSTEKACQQALWMKQALIDYDVRLNEVPITCDNKGAIDLSKNPVQHSRTNHIEIHHHFLRDNVQKGHISIVKVPSVDNIPDILTKPLKRESFNYLRLGLGMMEHIL